MLRRTSLIVAMLALVAALMASAARAQCPGQWLPGMGIAGVNGRVTAMTFWDPDGSGPRGPVLVAAGPFTVAGSASVHNVAAWDGHTWTALGSNLQFYADGPSALASYNGELIAAGSFLTPENPGNYQAIMRWNGSTWTTLGGPLTGSARSLLVWNGQLIVSGSFRVGTFGSEHQQIVASWNGSAWTPLTGPSMMQGGANVAIGEYGDLLIAGLFNNVSGDTHVLRRTASGWEGLSGQPGFVPTVLCNFQGELIATGLAGSLQQMARWNGTSWTMMSSVNGPLEQVTALCVFNGQLFALRGNDVRVLYRWNGTAWEIAGFTPDSLNCLATDGNAIYAGGQFSSAGGPSPAPQVPARNIVRYDGSAWTPIGDGINAGISAMIDDGSGMAVVGGTFDVIGGVVSSGVARLTPDGWEPRSFPSVYATVRALAIYNGEVVAGGDLNTVPYSGVAQWNGTEWQPVGAIPLAATIYALAAYHNELFAAGAIDSSFAGSPNIVRWNGSAWVGAGSGISTYVRALRVFQGTLVAGIGSGGPGLGSLVAWNGTTWVPYGGGVGTSSGQYIMALGEWNGKLVAAGTFSVPGLGNATIAAWDPANSSWTILATTGTMWSLATLRGDLYAGGLFSSLGGISAANIARWDGAWHALGLGLDGSVVALFAGNDRLLASGGFGQAGGRVSNFFATWALPTSDFNHDGLSSDADIEAFFACLAGRCCTTCGSADFDGDGDAGTDADIEAFFRVLAGGPC